MLNNMRTRKRIQKRLLYLLVCLGFLLSWSLLTFAILYTQDLILAPLKERNEPSSFDQRYLSNVQVVVGHYSGSLFKEKVNFTRDELDANAYEPIPGWGEDGRAVSLNITEELAAGRTFHINQFNLYVSDRISVTRSLPDVRKSYCRGKTYPLNLPTTSVVIVFHNEAFSTLLRSVHSVIARTPPEILREVILVDDYSDRAFLRIPLEVELRALSSRAPMIIIRAKERVGLIRARMMGASHATGDTLTFLDSHVECTKGWAEPLMARIKENRKAVVCPVIDVINDRTFAYQKGIEMFRGGFNWNLQFRWLAQSQEAVRERRRDPSSPMDTPTMAGGLFSMDKNYFEELGTYDAAMDIWGGENLEMSFRIWQCGGRLEIIPCSHIGHIFRKASPHDMPNNQTSSSVINVNLARVAEVWMDDWKWLFYKTAPQAAKLRTVIDVSERVELRKRLRCKSFRWYLETVFQDHTLPTPETVFGRVSSQTRCVVSRPTGEGNGKKHKLTTAKCTLGFDIWQLWVFSMDGRIKTDEHLCLSGRELHEGGQEWEVQLKECGGYDGERWDYYARSQTFVHYESGLCLTLPPIPENKKEDEPDEGPPVLRKCRRTIDQMWKVTEVKWQPDDQYDRNLYQNATKAR